jgi:hypothetical protein
MQSMMNRRSLLLKDGKIPAPGFICLVIIAGILIAGLWPFNFIPTNKVEWTGNRNGLRFYGQGLVHSPEPLNMPGTASRGESATIEILVQPHQESNKGVTSILTLFDSQSERFIFCQWKTMLIIRVPSAKGDSPKRFREVGIAGALEKDKSHLITVTSRKKTTDIYLDGILKKSVSNFSLIPRDRGISGRLVLGNSPEGINPWNGSILGLAVHDHILSSREILDHYRAWKTRGQLPFPEQAKPVALYRFDEQKGDTIRDHSGNRNHLLLPATFEPHRRVILGVSGTNQWRGRQNLVDVTINILGFAPFGFFFAAWLRQEKNLSARHSFLFTLLLGFSLSLAIELAQGYLPTRDSSALDLVSNTLGAALGVAVFAATRFRS